MSTFQNRPQNGGEHQETKSNLDLGQTLGLVSSLDNALKSYIEKRTNQPSYYPPQNLNTSHQIEEQQTNR